MATPIAVTVGVTLLEAALSAGLGIGIDSLKGKVDASLKDAVVKLDADRKERIERLAAIVSAATLAIQPDLRKVEEETGHDPNELLSHQPFLAQVATSLLLGERLDLNKFREKYQAEYAGEQWQFLQRPLLLFFSTVDRLLQDDSLWGPVLRDFRLETQLAGLDATALRIAIATEVMAMTISQLPEEIAKREHPLDLSDLERSYLRGLYADCNDLPLAGEAPPDAPRRHPPRLQRVYVDLHIDQEPTLERVLARLKTDKSKHKQVEKVLKQLASPGAEGADARLGTEHLTADFPRRLREDLSRENRGEAVERLQKLGIEPDRLAAALQPVSAFEALRDHTQLVLLGDPGSGKSTLTRRLAGILAAGQLQTGEVAGLEEDDRDWKERLGGACDRWLLPVRITLSRWATHLPTEAEGTASDLIKECVRIIRETTAFSGERLEEHFEARLNHHPPTALLLLDGLDEVTDRPQRKRLLAAVRDFCKCHPAVPLVVTCRVRPYREGKSYHLDLQDFTLRDLTGEAIADFLQRWHQELVWAGIYQSDAADQAHRRLKKAIADTDRPELHEMAGTPLLLTIMARVNYDKGLPGSRAALYEQYVNQLLWEWERQRLDDRGQHTGLELLLSRAHVDRASLERALDRLAYDIHGQKGSRDTVDIPEAQLRAAIEGIYPDRKENKAKAAEWAMEVLELIDARSGLLNALEQGQTYRFAHRTFQEYLAARWLATDEYLRKFKARIDDANWREAILLAFGYTLVSAK